MAGGISSENIIEALSFQPLGVDINSGVEIAPGKKDPVKLQTIFQQIVSYKQVSEI